MNYSTEKFIKELQRLFEKKLMRIESTDQVFKDTSVSLLEQKDENYFPTEVDKKIVGIEMLKYIGNKTSTERWIDKIIKPTDT